MARTEGSAEIDADEATSAKVACELDDLLASELVEGLEDAAIEWFDDRFPAKPDEGLAMENPEDAAD